ncbi:hypothetical protein K4K59_012834 [Colletotrichum sp. SAR11_240]|nr:hypothetical protein K4K59_012834 [Colletotrichum sp. SAR11_240]
MDIPSRLQSTRTAASSSTARTFFGRALIKSETTQTDDHQAGQPKGALGLTTLHAPNNHVLTDLIFVHGLNGGSESTWSKSDGSRFWPKHWLPKDDAFKDVRIHTFGYSSGLNRESVLNVHDFASSLLSAIQDSPAIAASGWEDVPLIFVGHSMGGLVIKKAYNLSCQNPAFQSVASRVRAIFFLATPHQGADIANTLSRILALVPGSRPFVNDLLPQSPALQAINEEFPRYSGDLQLFSFYETRAMYYGTGKGLIVEKNCAVMNYANERRTYLDANHRDVARFASPEDSNYLAVRNALATLMGAQRRKSSVSRDNIEQDRDLALAKFLGISDIDNDDVLMQDQRRLQGSGVWLFERQSFKKWRDAFSSELMWLRGRPGAGKSFLAGNVVKHLREHGHDCCSFFFASADNAKTTVNGFLRSMAFQMARLHPEIFDTITEMLTRKDAFVDKTDHGSVWRQLYLSGILKIKLNKQQYWVIDAVDECKAASEIMNFLGKAQESWPLCVFITSRNSFESTISRANPAMEVTSETIRDEDSNRDIGLFLRTNIHLLKGHTQETRDEIVVEVLRKSQGCFLWANLMLNELRQVHTGRETKRVLASNPSDMNHLYFKILDGMSRAKYGKDLAQSFLAWATCSFRPLSTEELKTAILVEVDEEIEDIEHSVTSCCGNLVYIDSKKRLQLIHLTAKEFLMNDRLNSEFAIDKKEANGRLAKSVALALSFIDDDLILAIAAKSNRLLYWDMLAGALRDDPTDWTRDFAENDDGPPLHVKQPTMAAISPHQHLLAVIYRGEDVLLWDLEQDRIHDIYQKDTGSRDNGSTKVAHGATTVRALAFSAAADTSLLATTYTDGDLIVYDTYTGHVKRSLPSQNAMVLHSSPDGRTLAGADTRANVVLYDFETLKFLYRISFDTNSVMAKFLSFTTNGQRLVDTMRTAILSRSRPGHR